MSYKFENQNTNIRRFIDEYQLEIEGIRFWTPYPYENLDLNQRREYSGKSPKTIPFKGRGTPQQIKDHLIKELEKAGDKPQSSEEFRAFMASVSLGVDCSGFSYYVLDEYLKESYGKELKYHLYKTRQHLLEIYDHPYLVPPPGLKRSTVQIYPDWISLAQIQEDWSNNPRYVVEAATFTNEGSTIPVEIKEIKPADLIGMMGYDGIGHHLLVAEINNKKITYAHSSGRHGRKDDFGGVEYGEIKISNPELTIEKQEWADKFLLKTHKFGAKAIRRLKVLR